MSGVRWTDAEVDLLISLMRSREPLWKKTEESMNNQIRNEMWEEISHELRKKSNLQCTYNLIGRIVLYIYI